MYPSDPVKVSVVVVGWSDIRYKVVLSTFHILHFRLVSVEKLWFELCPEYELDAV